MTFSPATSSSTSTRTLQNRAIGLFKDSLCRRGFLGLGAGETLRFTEYESDFVEIDERWYRRS
jgi:chemotaxis protein methyltransferase CheR